MKKYLFIAIAVLLLAVGALGYILTLQQREVTRLKSNQEHLLSEMADLSDTLGYYRTKSDEYAVSVGVLQLSKAELERNCTRLKAEIKDLGIKLKRVEEAATTATSTQVQIVTQVRDSIVYIRDSTSWRPDSLKYIRWQDPWVTFEGELRGEELKAQVESRDTLIQIMHRVPKKFLFFRWGTKEIRQEVKTKNPHTIITYTETIKVQ